MHQKEKSEEKFEIPVREYTGTELQKFHNMVQKYYSDYTMIDGEVLRVLDQFKLRIAYGALSKYGGVISGRYTQFENLYSQCQNWKVKTGLNEGSWRHKNLEQLDKLSEQINNPEGIEF